MDSTTEQLLSACELILYKCQQTQSSEVTWYFEAGSDAHLALIQAVNETRLTLGLNPDEPIPDIHTVDTANQLSLLT